MIEPCPSLIRRGVVRATVTAPRGKIEDRVHIVVDQQGRLAYANPAFQQALGRSTQEIVGQSIDQIFSNFPELLQTYRHTFEAATEIEFSGIFSVPPLFSLA